MTNSKMTNVDEFVKNLIARFLQEENEFLTLCCKRAADISIFRQNQHKATAPYGFEWAIQTSLSYFLSTDKQIPKTLKIGKKTCYDSDLSKYKKYDLYFSLPNLSCDVVLELKTIALGSGSAKSYIETDVKKLFPKDAVPYILVCSYPDSAKDFPSLQNAVIVITDDMPENFKYCVYRITKA